MYALTVLAVFAVVNVAVLILRREPPPAEAFRAPSLLPIIGAIACIYLVTPLSGRPQAQYLVAGALVVLGIVLWAITVAINKRLGVQSTKLTDPEHFSSSGPVN